MVCNTLYNDYVWSFTTCDIPDTTPPTVTYIGLDATALSKKKGPLSGTTTAGNIISVAFSKKMNPLTVTTQTVTLQQGTAHVSGTVFAIDTIAYFTPAASLGPDMAYTAMITTGVRDLAGNALANNYVWNFTTDAATAIKTGVISQSEAVALYQNYYNQSIGFTVPSNGRVKLSVFNTLGQEIGTLFNGTAEAGKYNHVQFNTSGLANGSYFSKLEFNGKTQLGKILLVK